MAPKKKPAAEGEVDQYEELVRIYRKTMKDLEAAKHSDMEAIFAKIDEEGDAIKGWNFSQQIEMQALRAMIVAMCESKYNQFEALRMFKCAPIAGGDSAVIEMCPYLQLEAFCKFEKGESPPGPKELMLRDFALTQLGCKHIGKALRHNANKTVQFLVLDFNPIGSEGVKNLVKGFQNWGPGFHDGIRGGLAQNSVLRKLSLEFCDVGPEGAEHLALMLMYTKSNLEELRLGGNNLGNDGVKTLFGGAKIAKKLKTLDVSNNKFNIEQITSELASLITTNTVLGTYDLSSNAVTDEGVTNLVNSLLTSGADGCGHIKSIVLPVSASEAAQTALKGAYTKKAGKKGKGKKKKK